jgi:hypothetical protein
MPCLIQERSEGKIMDKKHFRASAIKQGLLLIFIAIYCAGCPGAEMPNIDVSLWAGDSSRSGVTRSQEEKTLSCEDPQMDEFVCLTYEDLKKIYSTMLRCKKWGEVISEENTQKFIDKNPDVHHKLFVDKASATI